MENNFQQNKTIRHSKCELVLRGGNTAKRCAPCESHRVALRVLLCHFEKSTRCQKTEHGSRTNNRSLNTPEKVERLHGMRKHQKRTELQLTRLKVRLQKVIEKDGVQVDESLHDDLKQIATECESQVVLVP